MNCSLQIIVLNGSATPSASGEKRKAKRRVVVHTSDSSSHSETEDPNVSF